MRLFHSITLPLELLVTASAIYLLMTDPRMTSMWVGILLLANVGVLLFYLAKAVSLVLKNPTAGIGNLEAQKEIVKEVTGKPGEIRPLTWASRVAVLTTAGYMIWAGGGLTGCGEFLLAIFLINWVVNWLDYTTKGRKLATRLGIPLSPEDEVIIDG